MVDLVVPMLVSVVGLVVLMLVSMVGLVVPMLVSVVGLLVLMLVSVVGLVIVMVGIVASPGKLVVDGVGSDTLVVNVGFADVCGSEEGVAPFSRCFSITSLQAKVIVILICLKIFF